MSPFLLDARGIETTRTRARRWLMLACGSLILSGILALALVIGRTPWLAGLVGDPLFFKRGLVVHVDLSLLVWFYAFVAGLFTLIPARTRPSLAAGVAPFVALGGVALLVLAAGMPAARPLLSNYVPVIDHPLFVAGLAVIAGGIALAILDGRLLPGNEAARGILEIPEPARAALRAAAIAFLLAMLTFVSSWMSTPDFLEPEVYYELLFWGGGHVLQFASTSAMVAVWLILLTPLTGPIVKRQTAVILFALMLAPLLTAPILAIQGTTTGVYREGFTSIMRWGIFPAVSIFLVLCGHALWRVRRSIRLTDARVLGFLASAVLCVLGFVLGSLIRGSNTMVPAHYHASIGAVTASFMAVSYVLLEPLGLAAPSRPRLAAWQPLVFGIGQAVFAIGFGLAGAHGTARKVYGTEQTVRTTAEWIGLGVMGVGGLLAVAGGLVFLFLVIGAWRRSRTIERSNAWLPPAEIQTGSIPSRR